MSDFVIKRRRSRYIGPVDPCLGYYAGNDCNNDAAEARYFKNEEHNLKHEENFVPSSVPSEIELELDLNSSPYPDVNMAFEEEQNSVQQETCSIIDADWSILASYKLSATGQHRGYPGHANHDPELLAPEYLTVDEFLKQTAKINPKNIQKYGKRNKVTSDGTKGPKRRYFTLRRVQDSSDSPSSRVEISPHEGELHQPRSNQRSSDALADGASSDFDRYAPSTEFASSPLPSPAHSYHTKAPNRQRKRARNKRKSLRVRLYEAATSTHVEPEAAFAQAPDDPETDHRLPLRFLPEPSSTTCGEDDLPKKNISNWALIDPRKSRAIDDARFLVIPRPRVETGIGLAGLSNTLDRLPIDSWYWDTKSEIHSRVDSSAAKKRNQITANAEPDERPRPTCAPLTFVPIAEAVLLHHRDIQHRRTMLQKPQKKQVVSAGALKMVPTEAIAPKIRESLDENKALNLQPMQLHLTTMATQSAEDAPMTSEHQQNTAPHVPGDHSTPTPMHPLSDSHDQSEMLISSDAIQQLEACVAKRKAPPVSQINGHLHLFKKRKMSSGAQATPPPQHMPTSRPSTESKPLKPLVAFMGQFLENLRSVSTQCIDRGARQSSNQVAGRPSSRRKSSARTRISGSSKALAANSEPNDDLQSPSNRQISRLVPMEQNLDFMKTSGSCGTFEIAGPDLSTLFELEQNYHVMLSSPSS